MEKIIFDYVDELYRYYTHGYCPIQDNAKILLFGIEDIERTEENNGVVRGTLYSLAENVVVSSTDSMSAGALYEKLEKAPSSGSYIDIDDYALYVDFLPLRQFSKSTSLNRARIRGPNCAAPKKNKEIEILLRLFNPQYTPVPIAIEAIRRGDKAGVSITKDFCVYAWNVSNPLISYRGRPDNGEILDGKLALDSLEECELLRHQLEDENVSVCLRQP